MIAARQFQNLGRNAFDLPVAGLAAVAVAVFAFAIPGDLLGEAVAATGLPSLLTAAEPPLGLKARAAIGLVGAVAAFALVFFLMRRLDGGTKAPVPVPLAVGEGEMPKLRRRDSHPDAPARRPILAARDLGEPAPPARASTPVWLAGPEVEIAVAPEPAPTEPAPPVEASLSDLMARLERGLAQRRDRQVFARPLEPQSAPAPQVFPEAGDDRLQSAIDSLQRLAGRGD
jgi:hypothetical protein